MRLIVARACVYAVALLCLYATAAAQTKPVFRGEIPADVTLDNNVRGPMQALNNKGYTIHYLHALNKEDGTDLLPSDYRTYGGKYVLPKGATPSQPARTSELLAQERRAPKEDTAALSELRQRVEQLEKENAELRNRPAGTPTDIVVLDGYGSERPVSVPVGKVGYIDAWVKLDTGGFSPRVRASITPPRAGSPSTLEVISVDKERGRVFFRSPNYNTGYLILSSEDGKVSKVVPIQPYTALWPLAWWLVVALALGLAVLVVYYIRTQRMLQAKREQYEALVVEYTLYKQAHPHTPGSARVHVTSKSPPP